MGKIFTSTSYKISNLLLLTLISISLKAQSPTITGQPSHQIICAGDNTSFTITASDATGYQWQVNEGNGFVNLADEGVYIGTTTSTLSIVQGPPALNGYSYQCVVTGNTLPDATSNSVTLTVNSAPTINTHPSGKTICSREDVSFNVTALNASGYQWQVDYGSGYTNLSETFQFSGVNTSVLGITFTNENLDGVKFKVIISGLCSPGATSDEVILNIKSLPQINFQPSNSTICVGESTTFVVSATGAEVNYQWQVGSGEDFEDLSNSSTYAGVDTPTLTISNATTTLNGLQYRALVSNTCSSDTYSEPAILAVNAAPKITNTPEQQTVCLGANASFKVEASNATSYQWQVDEGSGFTDLSDIAPYSGVTTDTLLITNTEAYFNNYQYRVVINGLCSPPVVSSPSKLYIAAPPEISNNPSDAMVCTKGNTTFSITSSEATTFKWQVDEGSGFTDLSESGTYSGVHTSTLTIANVATSMDGFKYRCIAADICSSTAISKKATLTVNSLPLIILHPTNKAVCAGLNTSFSVNASGTDITYQWQVDKGQGFIDVEDNDMYSGTAKSTLKITGALAEMEGYKYRVLVKGLCLPSAVSESSLLKVNRSPVIIAEPLNNMVCGGNNTLISIEAQNATAYQWQVDEGIGFYNLSANDYYVGSATSTLSIRSASPKMNGFKYRCLVSGICAPSVASNVVVLSVSNLNVLYVKNNVSCNGANDGSILLNTEGGIGASRFSWSNGASSKDLSGLSPGTYSVDILDENNCSISRSFDITEPGTLYTSASISSLICHGGDNAFINITVVGGTKPYSYKWNNGAITEDIANLPGGKYTLVVTDANNCTTTATYNIEDPVKPDPVSFTLPTKKLCINEGSLALSGGFPSGGIFSGEGVNDNIFSPNSSGKGFHLITYTYKDPLGCFTSSAMDTIFVSLCNTVPPKVSLLPNTTDGKFNIRLIDPPPGKVDVGIFRMDGSKRKANTFHIAEADQDLEVNIEDLGSSMYVVEVKIGGQISRHRVIKR